MYERMFIHAHSINLRYIFVVVQQVQRKLIGSGAWGKQTILLLERRTDQKIGSSDGHVLDLCDIVCTISNMSL